MPQHATLATKLQSTGAESQTQPPAFDSSCCKAWCFLAAFPLEIT